MVINVKIRNIIENGHQVVRENMEPDNSGNDLLETIAIEKKMTCTRFI